jgi:1,4-dihydroxy-2-naphthoate octaprenyltransferase
VSAATFFGPMRLPFLALVPACVLLGVACAALRGPIAWGDALLALLGGLAAHIAVNALNEWEDFKSGVDLRTQRTPFSGGSGTLPAHPEASRGALAVALVAAAVTATVGLRFLLLWGWALLPLGLLGLLAILLYTRWLTRSPLLCLLAPGLGFGPCMVMGTDFALTGSYSIAAAVASLVPFFLVSDLLLLNQFPDAAADAASGRRHLIIVHGPSVGVRVYGLFLAGAYLSILAGVGFGILPWPALLGLLTTPLAISAWQGAGRHHANIPALIPAMGKNVLLNLATPLLVALGLLLGA